MTKRYAEITRGYAEGQGTMLDASNVPSLIIGLVIGALAAFAWGRRQTRR